MNRNLPSTKLYCRRTTAALCTATLLVLASCGNPPSSGQADSSESVSSFQAVSSVSAEVSFTEGYFASAAVSSTESVSSAEAGAASSAPSRPVSGETAPASIPVNADGRYVQPAGAPWNLVLVNPWNKADESYYNSVVKNHLTNYPTGGKFDDRATKALEDMLKAAKGTRLQAGYLFRTAAQSGKNLERKANKYIKQGMSKEKAYIQAATVIAPPYTSEHNLGLAVDLVVPYQTHLIQDFDKTEAFAWLQEHCAEYGFILRYPKGKQNITGIIYEPWHYRYVGAEYAQEIMSRGITLEEFLEEKGW